MQIYLVDKVAQNTTLTLKVKVQDHGLVHDMYVARLAAKLRLF